MLSSPETDPNSSRTAGPAPAAGPDPLATARAHLVAEWNLAYTALKRFLYLERQVLGIKLFDVAFGAALVLLGGFTVIAVSIAGALLVVIGARRGLEIWTHGAWWADVVLGGVILGLVALGAHLARRSIHRGTLARARLHLGIAPPRDPDVPAHLVPPPTRPLP